MKCFHQFGFKQLKETCFHSALKKASPSTDTSLCLVRFRKMPDLLSCLLQFYSGGLTCFTYERSLNEDPENLLLIFYQQESVNIWAKVCMKTWSYKVCHRELYGRIQTSVNWWHICDFCEGGSCCPTLTDAFLCALMSVLVRETVNLLHAFYGWFACIEIRVFHFFPARPPPSSQYMALWVVGEGGRWGG